MSTLQNDLMLMLDDDKRKRIFYGTVGKTSASSKNSNFCASNVPVASSSSGDELWASWDITQRDVVFFRRTGDKWCFVTKYNLTPVSSSKRASTVLETLNEMLADVDEEGKDAAPAPAQPTDPDTSSDESSEGEGDATPATSSDTSSSNSQNEQGDGDATSATSSDTSNSNSSSSDQDEGHATPATSSNTSSSGGSSSSGSNQNKGDATSATSPDTSSSSSSNQNEGDTTPASVSGDGGGVRGGATDDTAASNQAQQHETVCCKTTNGGDAFRPVGFLNALPVLVAAVALATGAAAATPPTRGGLLAH